MIKPISILCISCQWAACALLGILPFVVATDFGGVLHWTQYVAALVVLGAGLLATTALVGEPGSRTLRKHFLLLPVVLWLAYSYLQSVPLPASIVSSVSQGSADAYTTWISPYLGVEGVSGSFPMSVDVFSTRHATALLAIVAVLVWTSAMVFTTRARLVLLLSITTLGGAMIALLGIWRLIDPGFSLWSMSTETGGGPFSTFVNRNNAALMMNLGFAAGLGLICWRLSALTGSEIDDELFEFSDMVSMLGDRYALIGIIGIVFSGTGLLVCGSRGGLVAAIVGFMLALGWVRQRRGVVSLPVVGTLLLICVAILVVPTDLSMKSIERMELITDKDGGGIWSDGRLKHLPDGIRAAKGYFPGGSGLSTYAYSHLPFQKSGSDKWHMHADNLWLELVVEQGIVGIVLTLVMFATIIHSLYFLSRSPDPMDQGLRITGWYIVGAIFASQALDFGLIIPANLLLVACLLPAFVVRRVEAAVIVPTDDGHAPPPKVFQHRGFGVVACVIPVALFLFALPAIGKLRADADVERVDWMMKQEMRIGGQQPEDLEKLSGLLASQIAISPNPTLLDWQFRVEHERLRYLDVLAAKPDSESEVIDLFRQTSRAARRLSTGVDEGKIDEFARSRIDQLYGPNYVPDDAHLELLKINEKSLRLLPLGRDSRGEQISLEYIHRDPSKVAAAVEQLNVLYTGNSRSLMQLGLMAAETGNFEIATSIFREAIRNRTYLVRKVIEVTSNFEGIDQSKVLPEIPEVYRAIAPDVILKWDREPSSDLEALLATVKEGLKCDTCRTRNERAKCETFFGDIAARQADTDAALEAYSRALTYAPTEFTLWKKSIRLLRSLGDINGAREVARKGRLLLTNETEFFSKVIEELAEEEVRGIDESKLNDPSTIEQ